jgi:tripartite-type tricarboxylate transporter receptor subunit TctC
MLKRTILSAVSVACLSAALALGSTPLSAQEPFAGKTVQMIIGFGPGGGYDRWGRVVARHIGRHLPGNPQVVPQNMPGAGSYIAANHIYNVAPKDGTVMGIIARDAPLGPITGAEGARFDPLKLTWLGTPTTETNVCIAFHTSKVKSAKDLFNTEMILGDTGPGTGTHTYPTALKSLLGMKFKLIGGFPSSADVFLAMERGEVDGMCGLDWASLKSQRPDWVRDRTVNILVQVNLEPEPELSKLGVPPIWKFIANEADKKAVELIVGQQVFGRPYLAPPGVAAEALAILRTAFAATLRDRDFLADAERTRIDVVATSGERVQQLLEQLYAAPKATVDRAKDLVKP